jgi:hypothetical protein
MQALKISFHINYEKEPPWYRGLRNSSTAWEKEKKKVDAQRLW